MTARAEWIPAQLDLSTGTKFVLGSKLIIIRCGERYIDLEPKTSAEAAELSIALKRAQRRMDQIFRDMRAIEDAR